MNEYREDQGEEGRIDACRRRHMDGKETGKKAGRKEERARERDTGLEKIFKLLPYSSQQLPFMHSCHIQFMFCDSLSHKNIH